MRRTGPDRSVEASREAVSLTLMLVTSFGDAPTRIPTLRGRIISTGGVTTIAIDEPKMSGISAQIRVKAGLTAVARMRSGNSLGK
jgi:hypothetical protein